MKIAVIHEFSTAHRNPEVMTALEGFGHEVFNVGMREKEDKPFLDYVMTGVMTGLAINAGACDLVISGCGSAQGFNMSASQWPNVYCSVIMQPLDAWIATQINVPNVVSLAYNVHYGFGGDRNLKLMFEQLFKDEWGGGYPRERADFQRQLRDNLKTVSRVAHRPVADIVRDLDPEMMKTILSGPFGEFIFSQGEDQAILDVLKAMK